MDKINHPELDDLSVSNDVGTNDSAWSINGKIKSPHTITADELNGKKQQDLKVNKSVSSGESAQNIHMSQDSNSGISSSDFLYNRMLLSRNQATEKAIAKPKRENEPSTTADVIKNNAINENAVKSSEPAKEANSE